MDHHRRTAADLRPSVGRDTDSWCTKCNMLLSHTITAMIGLQVVRVKCGTCGSEHKFKSSKEQAATVATGAKSASTKASAGVRAGASTKATSLPATQAGRALWQRTMKDINRARAVTYTPQVEAAVGMLLDHKLFGFGLVEQVVDGKARVLFEDGHKTLVIGRV